MCELAVTELKDNSDNLSMNLMKSFLIINYLHKFFYEINRDLFFIKMSRFTSLKILPNVSN